MNRIIALTAGAVFMLLSTLPIRSIPFVFTDEASFLSAIAAGGYSSFSESFDGTDWDPSRPDGAVTITSQGLTWTGSELVRTGTGWVRTGTYGVYDSFGDPDRLFAVNSISTLYAIGGWFRTTTAPTIEILLGGTSVGATISLTESYHRFLGVIETAGFNSFTLATPTGHWGADDFTFARASSSVPDASSTLGLLSLAFVALHGVRRNLA